MKGPEVSQRPQLAKLVPPPRSGSRVQPRQHETDGPNAAKPVLVEKTPPRSLRGARGTSKPSRKTQTGTGQPLVGRNENPGCSVAGHLPFRLRPLDWQRRPGTCRRQTLGPDRRPADRTWRLETRWLLRSLSGTRAGPSAHSEVAPQKPHGGKEPMTSPPHGRHHAPRHAGETENPTCRRPLAPPRVPSTQAREEGHCVRGAEAAVRPVGSRISTAHSPGLGQAFPAEPLCTPPRPSHTRLRQR